MIRRYSTSQVRINEDGKRYLDNVIYPEIPPTEDDIYVISTAGDRYDLLARDYYGDSSLWWVISSANPTSSRNSLIPTPGSQIRIPASKQNAVNLFNRVNRNR